jgi:8-oxo-dGTP diphosphatase
LNSGESRPVIHVVAGVVIDAAQRMLIAQRSAATHLAGGWEFPGGKLEAGEDRVAGLARELREEIGIDIRAWRPRPLMRVRHAYPTREILLDVWVVRRYSGEPRGLEGQPLRWCSFDELAAAELLPADEPIVAALRLPERLTQMATPDYRIGNSISPPSADPRLMGVLCASAAQAVAAAAAGADFLVLREALLPGELAALCLRVAVPVFARGLELEEAWAQGASGVNDVDAGLP